MDSGYSYVYRVEVVGTKVHIDVGFGWESGKQDQAVLSIFEETNGPLNLFGEGVTICQCMSEMIPGFGGETARWQRHTVTKCGHLNKIQLKITKRWSGENVTGYEASKVLNAMKMAESIDLITRNKGAKLIRGFQMDIDSSWDYLLV